VPRRVFPHEMASQQYVIQIANGPGAEDVNRYAARLLSAIVGDDSGSRFFWSLVDSGRAECAVMYSYEYQGTGMFMSMLCSAPEDTADNLDLMRQTLEQVQQECVTDEELTQAKNKICSQVVLQGERSSSRLFAVGENWVQRHVYQTVREVVDAYQRVALAEVATVLREFPLTQASTVAVGPLRELQLPGLSP